ncbi:B12-binding domain-containing radical SAM protein [Pelagibacteraceae bacterium]|nr:B12-binding domain-containing radical SAM protein [Pelagibacteraceae bacterium]
MSLKILFVVYDNGSYDNVFPMGFGALAGILKKDGHEITVWNQDMHHWPDDHLRTYLDTNKFDVVVLSIIAGYYQYQKMKSLSKAINNSKNRPFYVMGGYGPTPEPEFFIKKSGCDVVCMGEGEITISKLMKAFENKTSLRNVPGVAWIENGKLQKTPRAPLIQDLDSLPLPPYGLFPMHYYRMLRFPKVKSTDFVFPLMSARGCSFKCTFCYRMDPGYRMRSPEPLLDEIEMLHKDYGITFITFQDDLLMSSVEHTELVCQEFLRRDLPVRWACNGRLNYCSEELLQLMKDSGCEFINYGIESMDQKVLNNMKKGLRPEMIVRGIEDTLKVGISPGLNFIFGNKGDNKKTIKSTVDFLLKYDDFAQKRTIRPVTPYPGSPLYYDAIEMGLLDKDNPAEDFYERKHLNSDLICCNFTELTDEEFYECLRWANQTLMKNYFDRQRNSTLVQINKLYSEKDASFRGFRHHSGGKPVGEALKMRAKAIAVQGSEIMDGLTNWEASQTDDAERFSKNSNLGNGNKNSKSFDVYLKRKEIRKAEKKAAREKKALSQKGF